MGLTRFSGNAQISGSIRFDGRDLLAASDEDMRRLRGNDIAMIFQDPLSSLHPFYKIGDQLVEAVQAHRDVSKAQALDRTVEMLGLVGIPEPRRRVDSYPHEFSGGMRQRVMIAMALINDPKLLIADEPTTALDVTVQAQILDLIQRLQRELDTAIVMITHDLGVVAEVADDIGVMYAGRIVEYADKETIFAMPEHPYTWGLLKSIPRLDSPRGEELVPIPGRPPSLILKPPGCAFHPRCPYVREAHKRIDPQLAPAAEAGNGGGHHEVACLLPGQTRRGLWAALQDGAHARAGDARVDVPDKVRRPGGRRRGAGRARHRGRRGRRRHAGEHGGHNGGRRGRRGARGGDVVSTNGANKLIEVRDLDKHFPLKQGIILQKQVGAVHAVDGITFDVFEGETLGLVGESGCGKSTTARLVTRLLEPTGGQIIYKGSDIAHSSRAELKPLRRDMQMIFQDPYSSLNPRKTVGSIIGEPFIIHRLEKDESKRKKHVQELMDRVGLNPEHYNRFPHEFSGGQRQRIGVARAIALKPKLVVADEPVSALDVSIQAQIINLLSELQRELGPDDRLHRPRPLRRAPRLRPRRGDVPRQDRRAGRRRPALRPSAPPVHGRAAVGGAGARSPLAREKQRQVLGGDVPSPTNPPAACRFHTRCPKAQDGSATSTSRSSRSRRAATSPPATSR